MYFCFSTNFEDQRKIAYSLWVGHVFMIYLDELAGVVDSPNCTTYACLQC